MLSPAPAPLPLRRFRRRKDYTGRYVGTVRPATWQEKLESLSAGLRMARDEGHHYLIPICEKAITHHLATDPVAYAARFFKAAP